MPDHMHLLVQLGNPVRAGLVDKVENYPYWDTIWL